MGARGSFSEQAGEWYITCEALTEVEIVPLITAESVLDALEKRLIDKAIFPIMNNNGGLVGEALQAMGKHLFVIENTFEMDIHHMLMAVPGMSKDLITTITSHDQALKQCRGYLTQKWVNVDLMPYKDTAEAASDLASGVLSNTTAVIASRRAADLYGLTIIATAIQDNVVNKTTFVVARRSDSR